MGRLVRKNLMVDGEKVTELARLKRTNASEAVRQAVDHALAAEEIMAAIRELHASGGIDDVFGKLPADEENAAQWPGQKYPIQQHSSE